MERGKEEREKNEIFNHPIFFTELWGQTHLSQPSASTCRSSRGCQAGVSPGGVGPGSG